MTSQPDINTLYKERMHRMTKRVFPDIPDSSIENALNYSIEKRYNEVPATIDNNYTHKSTDIYLKDLTNYILAKEPILTGWGVLFKKHGVVPNPLMNMVKGFMDARGIHKDQMFQFPKGTEEFAKFYMLQILDKLDANATYGVLSNVSCLLYNLYVAASIPAQGRECISTAMMFFEMFLSNSVKFASLDEVLVFIDNVVMEKDERQFNDAEILDRNIPVEECFAKLVYTVGDFRYGKIRWVPDEDDLDIIWNTLNRLTQEDINRIYYKNNLVAFMDNSSMTRAIVYILKKAKTPFLDPNKVPEDIAVEVQTLQDILAEYVYYHHQILDKIDRNAHMIKNVCVISDTDSAIVCLDGWYRFVLGKLSVDDLKEIEMARTYTDAFEYYDKGETVKAFDDLTELDYDFMNDDIIEVQRTVKAFEVIPQDNLRYLIINIMSHIIGNLANDYVERFVRLGNALEENKPCLMYLKNEFLFKRALLEDVKKHYATYQEVQEGNMVPAKEALDLKGLDIKKSTTAETTSKELQKIILEDILNTPEIDQVKIVKDLAILEKKIFRSIQNGEKDYYKPAAIKSLSSYDDPMKIQGVKAAYIWNLVRDEGLPAIDLSARNSVDIVKVNIDINNVEKIKNTYPTTYEKLTTVLCNNDILRFNTTASMANGNKKTSGIITAIALPKDTEPPKWLLEFVDYTEIINSNLKMFPIESVGIYRGNNANVNYTDIVRI